MFRLLIESSKDIDSLSINFSDGTSVIESKKSDKPGSKTKSKKDEFTKAKDELLNFSRNQELDTSEEFGKISNSKISKPDTQIEERSTKVATELQNLDI